MKRLVTRGWSGKPRRPINREGRRARRLKPADRLIEAAIHALPCVCGCNAHLQGKGYIARMHLDGRYYEQNRNALGNNYPACLWLSDWIDHTTGGDHAKAALLEMARQRGREEAIARGEDPDKAELGVLTSEEIRAVIQEHGYYTWLETRYRQD